MEGALAQQQLSQQAFGMSSMDILAAFPSTSMEAAAGALQQQLLSCGIHNCGWTSADIAIQLILITC